MCDWLCGGVALLGAQERPGMQQKIIKRRCSEDLGGPGTLRNALKHVMTINFLGPGGVQERPGICEKIDAQAGREVSRSA